MTEHTGEAPFDPRTTRLAGMVVALRWAAIVIAVVAAIGLAIPGAGDLLGGTAIGLLLMVPILRTTWLAIRWTRRGDRRFAAVAALVLAIVATGAFVAS